MNKADADKADADFHKIEYLDKHVPINSPDDIKALYEKAIQNNIFGSPVGWHYLANCRDALIESGYNDDELIPIPIKTNIIPTNTSTAPVVEELKRQDESDNKKESKKKAVKAENTEKKPFPIKIAFSLALNIILLILVILMFFVALNSENDNIINYRNNITNRYAQWQQSLVDRENAVRQKEKELGIEDTTDWEQEITNNY
ncbi:MAG: hypothetical protein K6A23_15115 [Butyrivibrio sp.]|nr:hypothetical protein [Butyrivibrio sp.]